MSELLQTYWPLIVAALLLGLVIAWYLFSASRKTRVSGTSGDVLDEGAACLHVRMVLCMVERDDRREARIGPFKQLAPFSLRFRGEKFGEVFGVVVPLRGVHLRLAQMLGRVGALE